MASVVVQFKCACMDAEQPLSVPARLRATDVMFWMEDIVIPRVAKAHSIENPTCERTSLESLKIPRIEGKLAGEQ